MAPESQRDDVRLIEAEAAPTRFARDGTASAWRGTSATASPTRSMPSGRSWWCFAARTAAINVLDGYCRHMGGDLSQGRSRATRSPARSTTGAGAATAAARTCPTPDGSRCWPEPPRGPRWTRTACSSSGTTPSATLRPADVDHPPHRGRDQRRVDRLALVHHDGQTPTAARSSTTSSTWRTSSTSTARSPRYFKNVFEGHVATQYMKSGGRQDIRATRRGPAARHHLGRVLPRTVVHDRRSDLSLRGRRARARSTATTPSTPTPSCCSTARGRRSPVLPTRNGDPDGRALGDFIRIGFEQDVAIWKQQGAHRQPAAVRGGRAGLSAATLVRAVLRRRRRRDPGDGGPLRVRNRHHPAERGLDEGDREQHGGQGAASGTVG